MTALQHPQKFKRQRRFLMMLPVLAFPFITMVFWALGGGTDAKAENTPSVIKGFNMHLPDAFLKDDPSLTKMSYYEQIAKDSAKLRDLIKNDPYYKLDHLNDSTGLILPQKIPLSSTESVNRSNNRIHGVDPNEQKIYSKLQELNKVLSSTSTSGVQKDSDIKFDKNTNPDIEHIERLMRSVNETPDQDPEMQQLSSMLDKILQIQQGENVDDQKKIAQKQLNESYASASKVENDPVSLLANNLSNANRRLDRVNTTNKFYSLDDGTESLDSSNAFTAIIATTQTLVNGSTIKLMLTADVLIDKTVIPANSLVYGIVALNGERLDVSIKSIRYKNSVFPINWQVHDLDGLSGIYIPGAITRDVAKQSADRAVQSIGLNTLDPSIGAQAASAGIEAARTLISKKVKLIKVTVKEGYQVLLVSSK